MPLVWAVERERYQLLAGGGRASTPRDTWSTRTCFGYLIARQIVFSENLSVLMTCS